MFVVQVSAQAILKDGKIPKDLVILYGTSGTVPYNQTYRIIFNGKVFYQEQSNLPIINRSQNDLLLIGQKSPKTTNLKDSLSKKQLNQIIREFEKTGFFEMTGSSINECAQNHVVSKIISISANGRTKVVEFFPCGSSENFQLKFFQSLYNKIGEELKTVKKHPMKNQ